MAASMLGSRTAVFHWAFRGISAVKCLIPGSSRCGVLQQICNYNLITRMNYNPKPLKFNLKDPYVPDRHSEETPAWQKTPSYDSKLYGRYGSASGVDPGRLWPSPAQLDSLLAEERAWNPPLEVMMDNIHTREQQDKDRRLAREKLTAANMAKMPQMVAAWRQERRTAKLKLAEEKGRRQRLLAEARERFGYAVDPRSSKFTEMVAELEKEQKKKKKLMKRRLKEEKIQTVKDQDST